jgi:hypothetical protein
MPFFNVVLGFPGAIGFWSLSVYLAATMSAHRAAQDPAHRAAVVDAAGYEPFLFPHRRFFVQGRSRQPQESEALQQ